MLETLDSRYRLKRVLGEGAMGRVYLADDTVTGQAVALKVVVGATGEKSVLQLQQEFRLMTQLEHPNCCRVLSYGVSEGGDPYFTMELVPGHGLDERLPLPSARVREVLAQLLLALGYVHSRDLVHRDIKAANVRVKPDGTVKLMDFGLMDFAGRAGGPIVGTLPYLAPEVIRRGPADERSDLYAVGALAYELLTGRLPFERETPMALLRAHISDPVPPLGAEAPDDLAAIVHRLLAKEPGDRYASAYDVLEAMGYEAPRRLGGHLLSPSFVGREGELGALDARLEAVANGESGGAVLLWGPAGAGKSRLLEELRFRAELALVPFSLGKAYETGNFPYRHFVWVLKGLLPALKAHVPETLERLAPVLVKLLPELDVPAAPALEPAQEKQRLQSSVTAALVELARVRSHVVVLENWQWADPLSVELLDHLDRNLDGAPLLLVVASRVSHEGGLAAAERLELGPLEPAAVARLIASMLGAGDPDPGFIRQVQERTGGNPGLVQRLLERLVADGALRFEGGAWRLPATLPALEEGQRVGARLSASALAVARAGALLGGPFELVTLRAVTTFEDAALFDAMTELQREGLVSPGEHGAYGLTREQDYAELYGQLSPETRLEWHRRALLALEADNPTLEVVSALARHALIAGVTDKAVHYALAAARGHAQLYANAEAEQLLLASLRQMQGDADRWRQEKLEALGTLGDVRRLLDNQDGALKAYTDALELAHELGDRATSGRLRSSSAKVLQLLGRLDEALETCALALADCLAVGQRAEAARCLITSARLHYYQGQLALATADVERGLALARDASDTDQIAFALGLLGYLDVSAGPERTARGIAELTESRALMEASGNAIGLHTTLDYLANAQLARGDYPQALVTFERKHALAIAIGYRSEEPYGLVNLATIALAQGRYADAERLAAETGALSSALDAPMPLAFARALEALASAAQGGFARAGRLAAEAEEVAEPLNNRYLMVELLPLLAESALFSGRPSEARRLIDRLAALVTETGMAAAEPVLFCLEGEWRIAGAQDARASFESAVAAARAVEAKGLLVRALKGRAHARLVAEAWDEARADLEEALSLARAIGKNADAAELSGMRGELAFATGESEAKRHFEAMAAIAGPMGSGLHTALALFGLAAGDPYGPDAGARVREARETLEHFARELSAEERARFLAVPERRRVIEGNAIAFSLARVRARGSGPLPPGMWRMP